MDAQNALIWIAIVLGIIFLYQSYKAGNGNLSEGMLKTFYNNSMLKPLAHAIGQTATFNPGAYNSCSSMNDSATNKICTEGSADLCNCAKCPSGYNVYNGAGLCTRQGCDAGHVDRGAYCEKCKDSNYSVSSPGFCRPNPPCELHYKFDNAATCNSNVYKVNSRALKPTTFIDKKKGVVTRSTCDGWEQVGALCYEPCPAGTQRQQGAPYQCIGNRGLSYTIATIPSLTYPKTAGATDMKTVPKQKK